MNGNKMPRMAVSVNWIPNYSEIRHFISERKNMPEDQVNFPEIMDMVDRLQKDSPFIPIAYQKIVALTMAYDVPDSAISETDKPMNFGDFELKCYVGDESGILKKFWNTYTGLVNKTNKHPIISTCDRRRGTEPLIIARTERLIESMNKTSFMYFHVPFRDLAAITPNTDIAKKVHSTLTGFKNVVEGFGDYRDKTDKWENSRPNYSNNYSRWFADLSNEISFAGTDGYDIEETFNMVFNNKWDELGAMAVKNMKNQWRSFVNYRYVTAHEAIYPSIYQDLSHEKALELVEFNIPKIHPLKLKRDAELMEAEQKAAEEQKKEQEVQQTEVQQEEAEEHQHEDNP